MGRKMKFAKKLFLSSVFMSMLCPTLFSCAEAVTPSSTIYVHVLNAEDYIDDTLIDEFQKIVKEEDNKDVQIVYETYDTNETMYNTLKTGKQTYDMICCSDYMIQRLAREGMLHSFEDGFDNGKLDNYKNYVSPFLADYTGNKIENGAKLNDIPVKLPVKDKDGNITYNTDKSLAEYAIGYMWGTLGILYNPQLIVDRNESLFRKNEEYKNKTKEELVEIVVEDFKSIDGYSKLWAPEFNKTQSIKDSMRDTYAIGIFEIFKDYFNPSSDKYLTKFEDRNEQFNKCDDETIKMVQESLIDLKGNIFGFEVDSGKDDIVTEKIGVNIAWSGDAVNSIGRGYYADDDWTIEREQEIQLYYNIPALGANVWFDAWCLPQRDQAYYSSLEYEYTLRFLDYLNDPYNAVANMSYNGYTTFIGSAGQSMDALAYFLYCYDLSSGHTENEGLDKYDIGYYFNFVDDKGQPLKELTLPVYDMLSYDSPEAVMEAIKAGEADPEEEPVEYTFKDEDGDGHLDIYVMTDLSSYEGRSLVAQLPQTSDRDFLYVMRDFEGQNDKIVTMWENVKVNPLPVWVTVTLITFLVVVFTYLGSYKLIRKYKIKRRKELRKKFEGTN